MKRFLVIGIRKDPQICSQSKVSDYRFPIPLPGCSAMCLYCYLVCHYNNCSLFKALVNREQMLNKIIKTRKKADKEMTFEIGSNSDLVLENTITGNLTWPSNPLQKRSWIFDLSHEFHTVDVHSALHPQRTTHCQNERKFRSRVIRQVEFGTSLWTTGSQP